MTMELLFAGYLIILSTQVMCQFSQCYSDVNICLWTTGDYRLRSEVRPECNKLRNHFPPRIINVDIQDKLAQFRYADRSQDNLLDDSGFWIGVNTTAINDFHWIDGSSLAGHFIYELAGIIALEVYGS